MSDSSNVVDPSVLSACGYDRYPSPCSTLDDKESSQPPSDQPQKKKRKAWGQPVPEIKQILPPRKRAKTAEEKEQRKNERILRNRRAADKSRQRQKAAVAELEIRQHRIEQENASLKELLSRYQSRFGVQADFPTPVPVEESAVPELDSGSSPSDMKSNVPLTPSDYQTPEPHSNHPTLVHSDDATPIKHESPVLAPQLNIINEHYEGAQSESMHAYQSFPAVSVSTGDMGYQASCLPIQPDDQLWAQLPPANLSDFDDISNLLNDNALADLQSLPDFGTEIVHDLDGTGFLDNPLQLPTNSFFDFDAFDTDQTCGISHEASEPTTSMQPTHGAPITGSDRPGFAASG
ncbi:transcription factor that binds to CRE motif [Elasticomyces elasticus]|nr:transcription factor that binds to CRE motif [Elasticomyces elasticus]KAK5027786.1 transcription factor that binds to CRE motif [Exophiala sideris]